MAIDPATATRGDRAERGIYAYLNRVAYVVINVSDLDRAVAFYEATCPVRQHCRLNGPEQPYRALGIEHGEFEGVVLRSLTAEHAPGSIYAEAPPRDIHLVQWRSPGPVGTPYREANHVGLYRHNSLVGDIEAGYDRVVKAGGRPYGRPSRIVLSPEGFSVVCFGFRDPDGTTLELIGPDKPDPSYPGALHHCNINCTDLSVSHHFYRDVMGFDTAFSCIPGDPQPITNGSLGDALSNPDGSAYGGELSNFVAKLMIPRNDWRNPLDVLEWTLPRPCGEAYASPLNLGMVRIGIEVGDINAAHARLQLAGVSSLSDIETWDMGEFGSRKLATLRDPDGVQLEIIEQQGPLE